MARSKLFHRTLTQSACPVMYSRLARMGAIPGLSHERKRKKSPAAKAPLALVGGPAPTSTNERFIERI